MTASANPEGFARGSCNTATPSACEGSGGSDCPARAPNRRRALDDRNALYCSPVLACQAVARSAKAGRRSRRPPSSMTNPRNRGPPVPVPLICDTWYYSSRITNTGSAPYGNSCRMRVSGVRLTVGCSKSPLLIRPTVLMFISGSPMDKSASSSW